jgi:hypothetical protein
VLIGGGVLVWVLREQTRDVNVLLTLPTRVTLPGRHLLRPYPGQQRNAKDSRITPARQAGA